MSTTTQRLTQRLPLQVALKLAEKLHAELHPGCDRIKVAGSLRRKKETVGDIEFVCIATPHPNLDLFGQPSVDEAGRTLLDDKLQRLVDGGKLLQPVVNGPKQKRFPVAGWPGVMLELFIVTPQTWGVQMMIRTGPAEFSKKMVTRKSHGGYMPSFMRICHGRLMRYHGGDEGGRPSRWEPIATPEERDLFAAMNKQWEEPCRR